MTTVTRTETDVDNVMGTNNDDKDSKVIMMGSIGAIFRYMIHVRY